MYSCYAPLSQILLKIPLEKCFFNFWSSDFFREAKIRFLAEKPYRVLFCFISLLEYGYNKCVYIWCENDCKIPVGKRFSYPPPLCTNGMSEYIMQLSVKNKQAKKKNKQTNKQTNKQATTLLLFIRILQIDTSSRRKKVGNVSFLFEILLWKSRKKRFFHTC